MATDIPRTRSSPVYGSAPTRTMREAHPLAAGHCEPCDGIVASLSSNATNVRTQIARPVVGPARVSEVPPEKRSSEGPQPPKSGDIVELGATGLPQKVDPLVEERRQDVRGRPLGGRPGAIRVTGERPGDGARPSRSTKGPGAEALSVDEEETVRKLLRRDGQVRAHEAAHKGAAGSHGGAVSLTYETGPDGRRYAIAGEVPVSLSPVKGDPQATVRKMQQIRQAALAPADPSGADRAVAAQATQMQQQAQADLAEVHAQKLKAQTPEVPPQGESPEPTSTPSAKNESAPKPVDPPSPKPAAPIPEANHAAGFSAPVPRNVALSTYA